MSQTLDGRFADGQTESKDKYSAKDGGARADQARPRTNIQVQLNFDNRDFINFQPNGRAEGESETRDR